MSGERRGKLYEVVVGRALEYAFPGCEIGSQVKLAGSLIDSDWVVSKNGVPTLLALVTHSGTETKFTQKFYRDVAEVIQALAATNGKVYVLSFIFDEQILSSLARAEAQIVNAIVRVAGGRQGAALIGLTDAQVERHAIPKDADWAKCRDLLSADVVSACEAAALEISHQVQKLLKLPRRDSQLGKLLRKQDKSALYSRPTYSFYRGCSGLMLLEPPKRSALLQQIRKGRIAKASVPWFFNKLVGSSTLIGQTPSESLIGIATEFEEDFLLSALKRGESKKASRYRQMLDLGQFIPNFVEWLRADRKRIGREELLKLLLDCQANPSDVLGRIARSSSVPYEIRVNWVWSFLISACREITKKKQSFGAKAIAQATGNGRYTFQNSIISEFENREWMMPEGDLSLVAHMFSSVLAPRISEIDTEKLQKRYLHETYVDKLGPHSVHPIPALILEGSRLAGSSAAYQWVKTSFGESVGAKGIAGSVRVIVSGATTFWWRSAHDGNEAHKSKEIGSRVVGLTTHWDKRTKSIERDAIAGSFVFVVDGDFTDEQLVFLRQCGVDKFLAPRDIATFAI